MKRRSRDRGAAPDHARVVVRVSMLTALVCLASVACGDDQGGARQEAPGTTDAGAELVPPRDTDIFLAALERGENGAYSIASLVNLTQRSGYDNQPTFVPDGSGLWYTAIDEHTGQADIWRYDFDPGRVARVTASNPESEYSATPLPGGSGLSVVRVEADSTQRLWGFAPDGSGARVLLSDVAPVGYHAWIDDNTVALYVLGAPPTLRVADLRTGRSRVVARGVGRSMHRIPGRFDVSYVRRQDDDRSTIMRLPGDGSEPEPLIETVQGGDDHAWSPDGTLLMAHGGIVYATEPGPAATWEPIADFSHLHLDITRLAVSPDGSRIAMVAELAPLEELPGG